MKYWLFKSEPNVYSIDDLANAPQKTDCWDGVRNYQARNFMRDEIKKGDMVLFYHSRVQPMAIVGIAQVAKSAYPDDTALDPNNKYFDPKSSEENPRWYMVDIKFKKKFQEPLTLKHLKEEAKLSKMMLIQKGARLSIQPVSETEYKHILKMAGES
ncbi:MAG: EVE domain-containing protein [Spirochaetota bacterium]